MFNPNVFRYKTAVMQRMQQLVARGGYLWYTHGEVNAARASRLAQKFADKYGVHFNENQRSYARGRGRANAYLLMYPKKDHATFRWWLLATEGSGLVHDEETLFRVTDAHHRLTWSGDYELVQLTREGRSKPVFTWRMTRACYEGWHNRIRQAVRKTGTEEGVKQAIWTLYRAPGFSEVRHQVKRLTYQLEKEWQRTRRQTAPLPNMPKRIGYVRMMAAETVPLDVVVRRMQLGKRPFPRVDAKNKHEKSGEVYDRKLSSTEAAPGIGS